MLRSFRHKPTPNKPFPKMKLLIVFSLFAIIFLFPGSVYGTLLSLVFAMSPRILELLLVGATSWAILKD